MTRVATIEPKIEFPNISFEVQGTLRLARHKAGESKRLLESSLEVKQFALSYLSTVNEIAKDELYWYYLADESVCHLPLACGWIFTVPQEQEPSGAIPPLPAWVSATPAPTIADAPRWWKPIRT